MSDLVLTGIAVATAAVFFGAPLGWLYVLVRRHMHPARSLVASYLASLIVIFTFSVVAIAIVVGLGFASRALAGLVGFGAAALGWHWCKAWLVDEPTEGERVPPKLTGAQSLATAWSLPGLNRWQIAGAALAVAVIGFLLIHRYEPGPGFVWNVVHAKIYVTRPCDTRPGSQDISDLVRRDSLVLALWRGDCGISFPYSGLLAAAVTVAALSLLWPRHTPHATTTPVPPGPPPVPRRGPPPLSPRLSNQDVHTD